MFSPPTAVSRTERILHPRSGRTPIGQRSRARIARAAAGALFACGILALACGDSSTDSKPDPEPPLPPTPRDAVLALRTAYVDRDPQAYARLLSEDFVFVFARGDVEHPESPTPAEWSLDDEIRAHQTFFGAETVEQIELTIPDVSDPVAADSVVTGSVRLEADNVVLRVHFRLEDGDTLVVEVPSGSGAFYLRPVAGTEDGETGWEIVRWEDEPSKSAGRPEWDTRQSPTPPDRTTWGQIKFLYAGTAAAR